MRLRSLEIGGFGHFRDFRIDGFSEGLTVLYGPNEAGKSTLMRFVNYALWGVQRGDLQRFKPLRGGDLGGALVFEGEDGQVLRVERRGRDLRAFLGDSEIGDDGELERVLGLDRGLFGAVFSFDLGDLASLRGLGTAEARERLFSGALLGAGASVAQAQAALVGRREVLWRPRAGCEIRALEEGISEVRGRLGAARRAARGVRALHEELRRIGEERARCEEEAARILGEAGRFAALRAAYGVFVEGQLAAEGLAGLGASGLGVDLAGGRVLQERLQVVGQARAAAGARLEAAKARCEEARRSIEGVLVDVALVGRAGEVGEVAREVRGLGRGFLENLGEQRALAERRFRRRLVDVGVGAGDFPGWTAAEVDGLRRAALEAVAAGAAREKVVVGARALEVADERLRVLVRRQEVLVAGAAGGKSGGKSGGRRGVGWAVVGSLWVVAGALLLVGGVLWVGAESSGMFVVGGVLVSLAVVLVAVVFWGLRVETGEDVGLERAALERAAAEVEQARAGREAAVALLGDLERAAAEVCDADWLVAVESWAILAGVRADSLEALLGAWKLAREMEEELADVEEAFAAAEVKAARLQGDWEGSWRGFCEWVERLEARVGGELRKAEQVAALERAAAEADEHLVEMRAAFGVLDAQFGALLLEGGLEGGLADWEEFGRALQVEEARAGYEAKVREAERGLRTILGGFWDEGTLEALALGDVAGWEMREAACRRRALEVQEAGRAAGEAFGGKAAELRALETSAGIAGLELELAQLESRLEEGRRGFAELLLAGNLLDGAMRTFREAHQPNVLRLASADLAEVTGGRYTGLRASEDGKYLEIVGAGGQVLTEDALSRGTTELLYIVLRLALVRDYAERGLRMPMVMDDVLVNLDVERAGNVAALLERVSREQQIVLLTCRPETVEIFSGGGLISTIALQLPSGWPKAAYPEG